MLRIRWKDSEAAFDEWKSRDEALKLWPGLVEVYEQVEDAEGSGDGSGDGIRRRRRRREVVFCETVRWRGINGGGKVVGGEWILRG
jgi:hypothetical protein